MIVSYLNKILGQILDTCRLNVGVPPLFVADTLQLLEPFHSKCNTFTVKKIERIDEMIIFIASSAPWMKFLLSQIYIYIAAGIGGNTTYLTRTNMQFHQLLKEAHPSVEHTRSNTFALPEMPRQVHSCNHTHCYKTPNPGAILACSQQAVVH